MPPSVVRRNVVAAAGVYEARKVFHGVIFAKSLDLGAGVGVEMAGGSLSSVYQRTKMRKVQLLRWTRGTLSQRYHHHHHHRDRPFQLLLLPRYVGGATWVLWH